MRRLAGLVIALALALPACKGAKAPGGAGAIGAGPFGALATVPIPGDSPLAHALLLPKGQPVEPDGPPSRSVPGEIAELGPLMTVLRDAGPREVVCQEYEGRALAILRLSACIFDLGSPEAARKVADALALGRVVVVGPEARIEDSQIRFAQGPLFVVARSRSTAAETFPSLLFFGNGVAQRLHEAGTGEFVVRFPRPNRVDAPPAFRPIAAFGLEGIDAAWTQQYSVDGRLMDGFYVFHGTADEARATWARYQAAFRALGARALDDAADCRVQSAFDSVFAAFVAGPVVGGVHMADDADAARRLCQELQAYVASGGQHE